MPRIRRATRRNRAAPAPHTPSHTTSFRHPVHSDLLWKHRDSHTSLLSNLHIVPRLPRSLLSNLHIVPRLPRDWAIVSYLLITLPFDWAIQLFVTTEVSN